MRNLSSGMLITIVAGTLFLLVMALLATGALVEGISKDEPKAGYITCEGRINQ